MGVIGKRKKHYNKIDLEKLKKMQTNQKFKKLFEVEKIDLFNRDQLMSEESPSQSIEND